ncbi:MAG: hypothetical protein ABEK16_03085 [Candidatus Nanohalobium sp.]
MIEEHPEELEGKQLVIKVQDQEEWEQEVLGDITREKTTPTLSFQNPEEISEILKSRTQKIIQAIKDSPPESIRELSRNTGIGLREVHEDLELLEENGILYFKEEGGRKKPRIPYRGITYQIVGKNTEPQAEPA